MTNAKKKLIGIGNAAIDAMIELSSESDISKYNLEKGGCVFVGDNDPVMEQMLSDYPNAFLDAGGASANAICAYAALGGKARLIAKTGKDDHGDFFTTETRKYGIMFDTEPTNESASTFLIAAITPDRERSFLSNHGASHKISSADVSEEWFTPDTTLIIDGYMLMSGGGPEAMFQAINYAQKHHSEIIFMPCSLSVIDNNREHIEKITASANALVCNSDEALSLAKTDDLEKACDYLGQSGAYNWGVITLGAEGAYYFKDGITDIVPVPYKPYHIENTNGAGDNFSGGLIYGLHSGMNIVDAITLGHKCAIHVLQRKSARCEFDIRHLHANT
jgi:sugar/nucleoside kinase (ribokinase family)